MRVIGEDVKNKLIESFKCGEVKEYLTELGHKSLYVEGFYLNRSGCSNLWDFFLYPFSKNIRLRVDKPYIKYGQLFSYLSEQEFKELTQHIKNKYKEEKFIELEKICNNKSNN